MAEDENNSVDLSNLSIEQINEMYSDIIEFPEDSTRVTFFYDCRKVSSSGGVR